MTTEDLKSPNSTAEIPEVRVLIPLWGARYISDFVRFSLPSLLAPGNLPLLARSCRLTVVFLTARKNFSDFRQQSQIIPLLSTLCDVEFIPIDDLVQGVGSYSVPLTLAYLRGMTETGDAMTRTYFICYNSDFILADGSMKAVLRHILEGCHVILAPSFRTTMEIIKPFLSQNLLRPNGQLSMRPREMVRLAFQNIHPTVISRIVNQKLFHSYYPNQIYWQVDRNTLLARFYLIMQFCIKPERRVESINNFVDYAFLPEMCPSGDMVAISDSDEFFMMELQPAEAEKIFVRPGPVKISHVAKSLSDWTTKEHRAISRFELVFHTEELPASLPLARKQLGQFMEKVEKRLTPQLVPYNHHHYWPGAVTSWVYSRQKPGNFDEEDSRNALNASRQYSSGLRYELMPPDLRYYWRIQRWKSFFLGIFWGLPPNVSFWHPQWFTCLWIKSRLRRFKTVVNERILYVTDETDFDGFFKNSVAADKVLPRDLLGGFLQKVIVGDKKHTVCFIHLTESNAPLAKKLITYIDKNLPETRRVFLFVGQNIFVSGFCTIRYTILSMLVSYFNYTYSGRMHYWFAGGVIWGQLLGLYHKTFTEDYTGTFFRNLAYASRILLGSLFMIVANTWILLRPKTKTVPEGCTGMMAEINLRVRTEEFKRSFSKKSEQMPVVAVFGAAGFIGRNLFESFSRQNSKTVGIARKSDNRLLSLDLTGPDITSLELGRCGVTHAIIAAGVPIIAACESDPIATRKVNVEGTLELAKQLCDKGIKVITLSSDYVFDGTSGYYKETSPVNPLNEYGRQKAEMEELLTKVCGENLLILRLSKVFDLVKGSGTLLDEIAGRLLCGTEVLAAGDQFFCPTHIDDVVNVVMGLVAADASGLVHLCAPIRINRYELARSIAEAMDCDTKLVKRISLRDLSEPFRRPLDTSMVCDRLNLYMKYNFQEIHDCIHQLRFNYQDSIFAEKA